MTVQNVSFTQSLFFILKNIFGISVREISIFTTHSEEAIYKSLSRTKSVIVKELQNYELDDLSKNTYSGHINKTQETLHTVFNMAYDSFDTKMVTAINEDICFDVLTLLKLLNRITPSVGIANQMALYCLHLARIPAKFIDGKFYSFFKQDRSLWDRDLIQMGFQYISKPVKVDKFYIEVLIVSKHMFTSAFDTKHWLEIIRLYRMLQKIEDSPYLSLNIAFCLHKSGQMTEAVTELQKIRNLLPDHLYHHLVSLHLSQNMPTSDKKQILESILENVDQGIRRQLIKQEFSEIRLDS